MTLPSLNPINLKLPTKVRKLLTLYTNFIGFKSPWRHWKQQIQILHSVNYSINIFIVNNHALNCVIFLILSDKLVAIIGLLMELALQNFNFNDNLSRSRGFNPTNLYSNTQCQEGIRSMMQRDSRNTWFTSYLMVQHWMQMLPNKIRCKRTSRVSAPSSW